MHFFLSLFIQKGEKCTYFKMNRSTKRFTSFLRIISFILTYCMYPSFCFHHGMFNVFFRCGMGLNRGQFCVRILLGIDIYRYYTRKNIKRSLMK